MTTVELNTYKMKLLQEIINHFNTETALQKLGEACRAIRKEEERAERVIPQDLFRRLMEESERQRLAGEYITDEELEKEMETW